MSSRIRLRDHIRETQLFSSRVIIAAVFLGLLIMALIARMVFLQIYSHDHYTTLSQNNRVNITSVPPTRGLIYDFDGVVLAQNLPSFILELIPEKIKDFDATVAALRPYIEITDEDIARYDKLRRRASRFSSVPLRFRLSEEEVARFSVHRHQFTGVDIQARLIRHYPNGELAVHALGYVARINEEEMQTLDTANYNGTTHIGKNGVERFYEDILHGKVGFRKVETNAQGRVVRVLEEQPPEPGENLYLNLRMKVQAAAEQAMGDNRGAVVAMDPKTGSVIALASMPGFDPNLFVNGIDSKTYSALAKSKSQPLFNRAIKGRYPPGSTIKPIIGLAGLEYDVVHGGSKIFCSGAYSLKNDEHRYRDWKHEGHGDVTLLGAIRESCDVYFYDLAFNLGIDRIYTFMKQFGFGNYTNVDMLGEVDGLLPSREWKRRVKREIWYPGETLITGIGQGFNLTSPLQLAVATATLANYGLLLEPRLGYATEDQLTSEKHYIETVLSGVVPIIKKENWDYVVDSMEKVVHSPRGTAKNIAKDTHYRIAGKTGTAQIFGIKQDEEYVKDDIEVHLRDHALFVAFAPVEDPKIVVAVIVENGGGGGATAAPIAKAVLDAYLLKEQDPS